MANLIPMGLVSSLRAPILLAFTHFLRVTSTGKFIQQAQSIVQIAQHIIGRANIVEFITISPPPRSRVIGLVKTGSHVWFIRSKADQQQTGTFGVLLKHGLL